MVGTKGDTGIIISSSSSNPSGTTTANTLWYNTAANTLYIYNSISSGWFGASLGLFQPTWSPSSLSGKQLWLDGRDSSTLTYQEQVLLVGVIKVDWVIMQHQVAHHLLIIAAHIMYRLMAQVT